VVPFSRVISNKPLPPLRHSTLTLDPSISCSLFVLFFRLPSFVFNLLQPLFAKHPGWGVPPRASLSFQNRASKHPVSSTNSLVFLSHPCKPVLSYNYALFCATAAQQTQHPQSLAHSFLSSRKVVPLYPEPSARGHPNPLPLLSQCGAPARPRRGASLAITSVLTLPREQSIAAQRKAQFAHGSLRWRLAREPIIWTQNYDPYGQWWLSALVAALPIIVLFTLLAGLRVKPHWSALAGAATASWWASSFSICRPPGRRKLSLRFRHRPKDIVWMSLPRLSLRHLRQQPETSRS